jgi:hypothetical protein
VTRGHVAHTFFPLTATVAHSIQANGGVGFGPVSPEEKVILIPLGSRLAADATTSPHVLKSVPSRFKELQGKVVVL